MQADSESLWKLLAVSWVVGAMGMVRVMMGMQIQMLAPLILTSS